MSEPEQPEQTTPAYVPESRLQRGVRYSHRTGLYLSLAIALATIVFLILLIARNTTPREARLRVRRAPRPGFVWLVIISAITGWVLGIVTAFLIRRRTRWRQPA